MSLATDLAAATASAVADAAKLHAIVAGPASGAASLVTLADGVTVVKTLARIAAEAQAMGAIATPVIAAGLIPIDLSAAGNFLVDISADITGAGLTITNPLAGVANSFTLQLKGKGTVRACSITGVTWINGVPAPSTTNGKRNIYNVFSLDGGASWLGMIVGENL